MAYIGNSSTTQSFTPAIDYFSGNGSTTAFTLSRPVASAAQVMVVVNNVPQHPTTAFSVSGNTITFTGAPSTGTNNIYVMYTTLNQQVIQPGQGTVGTTQLVDSAVTAAKIVDATITPGKLTVGAISWDSSGRVTMPYQPAFCATCNGGTIPDGADVVFQNIVTNIGGHYNPSNGRFTAPVSGTYRFAFTFLSQPNSSTFDFRWAKNGVNLGVGAYSGAGVADYKSGGCVVVITLTAGDYVTCMCVLGTHYLHVDAAHNVFSGELIG